MRRLTRASAILGAVLTLAVPTTIGSPALAVGPTARLAPAKVFPNRTSGSAVTRTAYRNPVSRTFADTFADPSVIRGKDGWWYSYGTSDPLRAADATPHRIPIARSADLVRWTYVADAFSNATLPKWATPDAGLWGPDIRYVDGQYRMYYVVTQTTVFPGPNDNAIGMATAPTPVGPWVDSGAPVVGPRLGSQRRDKDGNLDDFKWTFDPSVVTDRDGSQWLFYGSYYGGVYVQRLTADGRSPVGQATMVAIDNKFEGAYVVRRGGYWFLFASTANCCGGPTTGYSVQVGRSRSLAGPYVDRQGVRLTASRAGGTPTLMQNGNAWIGAGHNAIATDLSGQDWIVYHALNRADPYLTGTDGINQRPMLMDRLDWIQGWPQVRAGRGPSSGRQTGPATGGRWVTTFSSGIPAAWRETGSWDSKQGPQSGGFQQSNRAGALLTRSTRWHSARVEADLRSSGPAYGLRTKLGNSVVRVLLDPKRHTMQLQQRRHGRLLGRRTATLPAGFAADAWHSVALEVRRGRAVASVSHARLGDPLAVASLSLRGGGRIRSAGVVVAGGAVDVDNLSVLPAFQPVKRLVSDSVPSRLDRQASDEFNGRTLNSGWSWVRRDARATVRSGGLRWPVEQADLTGPANTAGVLLRSPGTGSSWSIQTKVSLNVGTVDIHNYQQAGLVAYASDDLFTRFSQVAIWNTRQTEFGKEMPYAGRLSYGGTIVGPPARTTWLRITHRTDPRNGEHELRAWSSRNGHSWVKGGVWTLPAGSDIRVGLISHGRAPEDELTAVADFDYFRVYRG